MGFVCLVVIIYLVPIMTMTGDSLYRTLKILAALTVVTVVGVYILNHYEILAFERLFENLGTTNGASGLTRGDTWSDVWKIFKAKPVLGWGYSSVGYNVFVNVSDEYNWGMHSSYFVILCEMGIIGSALFFLFFFFNFKDAYTDYRFSRGQISDEKSGFSRLLVLCCVILLLNAYSEAYLFSVGNPMAICFWMPFIMLGQYNEFMANECETVLEERGNKSWKGAPLQ
ncbi:MAG: O-antigen ligase family protein [Bacteroides thetaiotaomicron]|nr:O-antigen ligase family protein [Bacteroides thetaiotaomicron]